MGVCWTLNFIRECRKIKKLHSNLELLKKKTNRNDRPVCVVCFTVCSPLEPFGSCSIKF